MIAAWPTLLQAHRSLTRRLFLLIAALLIPPGLALDEAFRFQDLTVEDGLSINSIQAIVQDETGFVWIATSDGLNRYDGQHFKTYRRDAPSASGLPSDWVNKLLLSADGRLWAGTQRGLALYRPNRDEFTGIVPSLSHQRETMVADVSALHQDPLGGIWVGGANPWICRYDDTQQTFRFFRPDVEQTEADDWVRVYAFFDVDESHMLIGTLRGLYLYEGRKERVVRVNAGADLPESLKPLAGLPEAAVISMHRGADQALWIGTNRGLFRLAKESETLQAFQPNPGDPHSLSQKTVIDIFSDRSDRIWIGTEDGLNLVRPDTDAGSDGSIRFRRFQHDPGDKEGLTSSHIYCLFEDRSGLLWVGTGFGGVNLHDPDQEAFGHYRHEPTNPATMSHNNVWALLQDSRDRIWVGLREIGLDCLDPATNRVTRYRPDAESSASAETLRDPRVVALAEDAAGRIWVGTFGGGLHWLDPDSGQFTHISQNKLGSVYVFNFLVEPGVNAPVWIGTYHGLVRYDAELDAFISWKHDPDDARSLSHNWIQSTAPAEDGRIWVGTHEGLDRFDPRSEAFERFSAEANGLTSDSIYSLQPDRAGRLWIGTPEGLNRLDPGQTRAVRYGRAQGLPNTHVVSLSLDGQGMIWGATNSGLFRLDPDSDRVTSYFRRDGLQSDEFNLQAAAVGNDGRLMFGGVNGFNRFFPAEIDRHCDAPSVVLTQLRLNNRVVVPDSTDPSALLSKPAHLSDRIHLAYDQDHLTLEFAGLDFSAPDDLRYRYRLEGFDREWIETSGSERLAVYTDLDAGSYQFQVAAADSEGNWGTPGAGLSLEVDPAPWQTWWAYGGYGLIILALLLWEIHWQRSKLAVERENAAAQKRLAKQRQEMAERDRQLNRVLKRRIEAATSKLQEQNEALQAGREKLLEADRLKTAFFTNISHELRTPLTLILNPLEDLREGTLGAMEERAHERLDLMHRHTHRLLGLINQLLDVSKLEAGQMVLHPRREDVALMVDRCVAAFRHQAERLGIDLERAGETGPVTISCDEDKLEKVLFNLLSNAFKHTPAGGKVTVSLEAATDGGVSIQVADTGQGIAPADLPHIFDRFYQAPGAERISSGGTGIGLALARELVQMHGGDIRVRSEPEEGTRFTVALPKAPTHPEDAQSVAQGGAEATATGASLSTRDSAGASSMSHRADYVDVAADFEPDPGIAAPPTEDGEDHRPTVLVVEDHRDIRRYLREKMEDHYRVVEAINGEDGFQRAREWVPDLVLSDVMMPGRDGFALCEALKGDERTSHIPVVLLTARADEAGKLEGLSQGADDYLSKPFSTAELLTRMGNLIEGRKKLADHYRRRFLSAVEGSSETEASQAPMQALASDSSQSEEPSADEMFLQRIADILEELSGNPSFGVEDLAAEVGYSRRQLLRKLTALTGRGPSDVLREYRLARACELLSRRVGGIAEVAHRVGFKNVRSFSAMFRETYGQTPTQFVNHHRDSAPTR
ncbi:hybrid sensor histidine kinase/response regulator transcription factor [Sulfidibacter corallicola]|uniref:histidine kinase n=1 Tax=Sulfidibacter corallicola TaxID=2818388 RepID=A0A8A4TXJ9_SULCO|nr:hybrid sensor histidine kinase/response regulator transcription factor [Sulfidibacter corallicola]QTD51245.1 response regulator [Sulfidibacter corallicola]